MTTPDEVAVWVSEASRITVLTGAGISTESGIPDYRGPDGAWTRDPAAARYVTFDYYVYDPQIRRESWRRRRDHPAWSAKPNAGHRALVELERAGKLRAIVTQNIDGLHVNAGNSPDKVVELHGTIFEVVCLRCDARTTMRAALSRVADGEPDPACMDCGGILKSATIFFGQNLDPAVLAAGERAAADSDLFLAVGTSLGVFPAAGLVEVAADAGARIVIVNAEPTPYDAMAEAVLREPIGQALPGLVGAANLELERTVATGVDNTGGGATEVATGTQGTSGDDRTEADDGSTRSPADAAPRAGLSTEALRAAAKKVVMPAEIARRRFFGVVVWTAAFIGYSFLLGLPMTDPVLAFGWLWLLTIAWNSHYPRRQHLGYLRDWLPIVVLFEIYNVSRGFADQGDPHVQEMIDADSGMFGAVPTVWLQDHLYDPDQVQWWDMLVSLVYFSHFVVAFIIAIILWLRNRPLWLKFVRRWFFLNAIGLATYFAYPAAPPWWASEHGLIDEVERISTRGWAVIGLRGAGNMLNGAQVELSNPVAAMPSLHTAYALLVVAFFFPMVRKRWIPLLLLYPLAMTFTLVYSAEHWIIDVLVGWVYVGITFLAVAGGEKLWSKYRRSRSPDDRAGEETADEPAVEPPQRASVRV